jgi:hypothetical protein
MPKSAARSVTIKWSVGGTGQGHSLVYHLFGTPYVNMVSISLMLLSIVIFCFQVIPLRIHPTTPGSTGEIRQRNRFQLQPPERYCAKHSS